MNSGYIRAISYPHDNIVSIEVGRPLYAHYESPMTPEEAFTFAESLRDAALEFRCPGCGGWNCCRSGACVTG